MNINNSFLSSIPSAPPAVHPSAPPAVHPSAPPAVQPPAVQPSAPPAVQPPAPPSASHTVKSIYPLLDLQQPPIQSTSIYSNPTLPSPQSMLPTSNSQLPPKSNETAKIETSNTMTQQQLNNLNYRLRTQPISCHTQHIYSSRQSGAFDTAITTCIMHFSNLGYDIQPISSWLLYSVCNWCFNKEVLVILTQDKLWVIRYNWIVHKVKKYKVIDLINVSEVNMGKIYKRQMKLPIIGKTLEEVVNPYLNQMDTTLENNPYSKQAIRIYFNIPTESNLIRPTNRDNLEQLYNKLDKKWNPFSTNVSHLTFKSHIVKEDIAIMAEEPMGRIMDSISIPETRSVNNFTKIFNQTLTNKNISYTTTQKDIEYDNATGVAELIYNRNQLGSCRRRGNFIW